MRLKRRIFSGAVCEQVVFTAPDRLKDIKSAEPKPRFKSEEERARHREGISRRRHAQVINTNYGPTSLYSTLTFNNEYEVHTFPEARRLRDNLARRLRYHAPEARFHIYMGRGKGTNRIHFHMLSEGLPEELIHRQWVYGDVVRISKLRAHNFYDGVDHGQDYTGLANYLFDHWTPEQGGHRWKQTRNMIKPEREEPTVAAREYTENRPPRAPKGYVLVETRATQWGCLYYKYVLQPPKERRRL